MGRIRVYNYELPDGTSISLTDVGLNKVHVGYYGSRYSGAAMIHKGMVFQIPESILLYDRLEGSTQRGREYKSPPVIEVLWTEEPNTTLHGEQYMRHVSYNTGYNKPYLFVSGISQDLDYIRYSNGPIPKGVYSVPEGRFIGFNRVAMNNYVYNSQNIACLLIFVIIVIILVAIVATIDNITVYILVWLISILVYILLVNWMIENTHWNLRIIV